MSTLESKDISLEKRDVMLEFIQDLFSNSDRLGYENDHELLMYLMSSCMQVLNQLGGYTAVEEYCDKTKELYVNLDTKPTTLH